MISWRYHVISIVAVILAFGLGILAGTSVVGDRFARDLQLNYDEAIEERDAALDMVALQQGFAAGLRPTLRDGVLAGEQGVVVTVEGIDGPAQVTVDELTAAGVDVLATLTMDRRLTDVPNDDTVAEIEEILGVTGSDPGSLAARIADALAVRLAVGPEDGTDLLGALLAAGLVTADRDLDEDALLEIGGIRQLVVVAAGGRTLPDLVDPQSPSSSRSSNAWSSSVPRRRVSGRSTTPTASSDPSVRRPASPTARWSPSTTSTWRRSAGSR